MIPPMNQSLTVNSTRSVDENGNPITDRYGREIFEDFPVTYSAGVKQETSRIVRDNGVIHDTNFVIDVENNVPVESKMNIKFTDIDGNSHEGIIEKISEATNFAGNRILYKVLMVDGK